MKENTQEKQELPEFIQGLATKKSESKQRREIVEKEYLKLLDRLGRKNGKNKKNVRNDFLDVNVWFTLKDGGNEASNRSTFNWQSAYAILHLETIVKKAKAKEGTMIYSAAKPTGKQQKLGYVNVATLYYDFVDAEKPYMNFTVQLLLGVRNNGKHLQYAINKVDVV